MGQTCTTSANTIQHMAGGTTGRTRVVYLVNKTGEQHDKGKPFVDDITYSVQLYTYQPR